MVMVSAMSRRRSLAGKILYLSYHDSLTGLYNRRFMEEIKRLKCQELPLAIIAADVNGLKRLTMFSATKRGQAPEKAAEILRGKLPERHHRPLGRDEFLILLPRTSAKTAGKS